MKVLAGFHDTEGFRREWVEAGFIGELKRAPVHAEAEARLQIAMDLDGIGWVDVLSAHEPARFVGSNGKERHIRRAEARVDVFEKDGMIAGGEVKAAPKPSASRSGEAVAPVLCRRQRQGRATSGSVRWGVATSVGAGLVVCRAIGTKRQVEGVGLPPIELHDAADSCALQKPAITERSHRQGGVCAGETRERGQIAMIVVIVAEQDGVDGRQFFEVDPGGVNATRSDEAPESDALAENRIGEQGESVNLQEKRGMVYPRDHRIRRSAGRWRVRRLRDDGAVAPSCDPSREAPPKHG